MKAGLGVRLGTLVGVPGLLVGVLVGGVPVTVASGVPGVVVVSPPDGCSVAATLIWSAGLRVLVGAAVSVGGVGELEAVGVGGRAAIVAVASNTAWVWAASTALRVMSAATWVLPATIWV